MTQGVFASALIGLPQVGFLMTLVAVGLWATFKADEAMTLTFAVLVLNCLAGWGAVVATGDVMPLVALIFIDTATAAAILWFARCDEQVVIGWLLFIQIGIHIGTFAAGAPDGAQKYYSNAINVIGWGQILLLTIGTHNGTRKRLRVAAAVCRHLGVHSPPAHARTTQR